MKTLAHLASILCFASFLVGCGRSPAWNGGAGLHISVTVLPAMTGAPIQNARILVIRSRDVEAFDSLDEKNRQFYLKEMNAEVHTSANGTATVYMMCPAGGTRHLLGLRGSKYAGGRIEVTAKGYKPHSGLLQNLLQKTQYDLNENTASVVVYLESELPSSTEPQNERKL